MEDNLPTTRPTIAELEAFFASVTLPASFDINEGEHVADVPKFVRGHIATIKANAGSRSNEPFMDRLIKLKEFIESNS